MELIEALKALNWRYATMKTNGKLASREQINYIREAARLAPSSSGLQAYQVFVITNKKLLEKIKAISYNQSENNNTLYGGNV